MTDKIRRLLQKGKTAQEIAAQLKIKPNRVYTVKWLDAKKQKPSKIIKAVNEMKTTLDALDKIKDKPAKMFIQPAYKSAALELLAATDLVNHPPHYKTGGIETIDFIEAKDLNYRLGNVIKYVSRAGKKASDPVQDLEKAAWYLQREIDARKSA
jgi:hypothetical protein